MPRARSILAAALLTAAAACGDEGPNISGVDPATIARIEISPRVDTILIADTIQARDTVRLHALVYGNDGELREGVRLAWASLDSAVAVPDADGVVTAVGVGTTQVQASAGKFDRATVVVLRAARTVTVSPPLATATGQLLVDDPLRAGDTLRLRAVARDEAGAVVPGVAWTWTSSAPSVATVDAGGLVTARGLGQTSLTAATTDLGGEAISSSFVVTVAPLVQQVTVRGLPARSVVGDTIQLSPETYGRDGRLLSGRSYQWASSEASVATVGDSGRVIVLAPGRFTITARTGFVTGTALAGSSPAVSEVDVLPRVFVRLDAGGDFTCAAISLDRPYCFGLNDRAQLANATSDTTCIDEFAASRTPVDCSLVPLRVAGGRAFAQLSAGGAHACGLEADGLAYCWGSGEEGARGDGTTGSSPVAKLVTGALRFASISAGGMHTCALTAGGAAWCWGDDRSGQLGNFKKASSTTPIPVEGGLTFSQLVTGMSHTCAVRSGGETYCWGANDAGQLGDGTLVQRDVAAPVAGFSFVQVTAGGSFSCGLTSAGAAHCWGQGDAYQLGRASTEGSSSPVPVSGGLSFTAISAGDTHACALAVGGQVYCWGTFQLGRVGSELFGQTPQPVGDATGMVAVTAGRRHACALRDDGTAWCWGSNVLGPFGDALQALWRPRLVDPVVLP